MAVLVPTEVVSEPEAMVLVTVPLTELVTTAVSVHAEACGIKVPAGSVNELAPAPAETLPALQPVVVVTDGEVLTSPAGYRSVNSEVNVAETSACVLTMLIVSKAVPPAPIVVGEKLFEIVGLDGPTVSTSAEVQVWLTQVGDEFVLVTLRGGEIAAVLVT